jgi:hypothetical protein
MNTRRLLVTLVIAGALTIGISAPTEAAMKMPNIVGMTVQDAQDLLQSKGSYSMDQQDATGMGRWLLLDDNWKVCSQRPAPGARFTSSTRVRVNAVKLHETCPRR